MTTTTTNMTAITKELEFWAAEDLTSLEECFEDGFSAAIPQIKEGLEYALDVEVDAVDVREASRAYFDTYRAKKASQKRAVRDLARELKGAVKAKAKEVGMDPEELFDLVFDHLGE